MAFSSKLLLILLLGSGIFIAQRFFHSSAPSLPPSLPVFSPSSSTTAEVKPVPLPEMGGLSSFKAPLDRLAERVTKKPFGLKVSPANSPIQPERFQGFHTGVDFEAFTDEADKEVSIMAICSGKILQRRWVSGYGGLVVQGCDLKGERVTVVYGHVKIASVDAKVGDELVAGQAFAVLGKGFSQETDGERKHLHLGIHKGSAIDIRGYVSTQSLLDNWKDYLKQ